MKPVASERFSTALQRARDNHRSPESIKPGYVKRFLVERNKAAYFLPVHQIDWIAADRNYARLFSTEGEFALRTTIEALQEQLDPVMFVRVSRSAIVRLSSIRKLKATNGRDYIAHLSNGAQVTCSSRYWKPANIPSY